jgi:hypothetical protein
MIETRARRWGVLRSGSKGVEPSPWGEVPIAAPPACSTGGDAASRFGVRDNGHPRSSPQRTDRGPFTSFRAGSSTAPRRPAGAGLRAG